MKKFFIKYTAIIFLNLFAFLVVGHILDVLFGGGGKYKVIFLIISVIPLLIVGKMMIQKTLGELENISPETENGRTTND